MADQTPQAAFGGCLARVFNLFGFFFLVTGAFAAARSYNDGGTGISVIGALVPGLALILLARAIRRRVGKGAWAGDSPMPGQQRPQTIRQAPTLERKPSPTPQPRPVPIEMPEVLAQEPPDQSIEAIEQIEIDDFEPDKPLSSEERIRQARRKYNKDAD